MFAAVQQVVLRLSPLCGILNQGCAPFANEPQYVWLVDFVLIQQHLIKSHVTTVA
jgi:hypothetical protein